MSSVELQGLNHDHFGHIFDQYDHNNDGFINHDEFKAIIGSTEFRQNIPAHVVKEIFRRADKDGNGQLDRAEFVRLATNPATSHIFESLRARGRQYVKLVVPRPPPSRTPPTAVTTVDGAYEDEYSCWPPKVAMVALSAIIVALFAADVVVADSARAQGPVATDLLYDPHRRREAWRYLTYMFVHVGRTHLVVNVFVQLMLGVPLEMVHGGPRVLLVYAAGVVAGSLGTSVCDPRVKLAGASGGVYSLMTAHIATIIMNWTDMSFPLLQLLIFVVLIGADVGTAVYNRYVLMRYEPIGYAAHFFGALAGLLVGITVLRNISVNKGEKWVQIVAVVLYVLLMAAAIAFNVAATSHFPVQYV